MPEKQQRIVLEKDVFALTAKGNKELHESGTSLSPSQLEVLLKMRQHPALKAIPVVMLTAQATRDAVLKGLASGADGYITKPFRIEVLSKAVAAVLGIAGYEDDDGKTQDPWSLS